MPMDAHEIEQLIKSRIPDAEVTIRDLAGDGDHYAATVIAESFRGKSRVQQHQIVYEALRGEMGGKLHALALQTGTPESYPRNIRDAVGRLSAWSQAIPGILCCRAWPWRLIPSKRNRATGMRCRHRFRRRFALRIFTC